MSPTTPRSRGRTAAQAGADKPKTTKPRAVKATKASTTKTARPRVTKAHKPEAAERQLDLIAPIGQEAQTRHAPTRAQTPVKPRAPAATPAATEPDERRRAPLLFIVIPLLMLGSFWIGRVTTSATRETASAPITIASPAAAPATIPPGTAPTVVSAPQVTAGTKTAAPGGAAASRRAGAETSLVEVSVGTTSRGGLALRFDHPVAWQVTSALGGAEADLDVRGVRALGTFPRNLPLPPGVSTIRAGITAPDTLNLKFALQPGIRAFTVPGTGPAASLNIYFRTPAEEALDAAEPATGACGGSTSPQAAKAMGLLQRSLDKNPGYEAVRQALALLETCAGDGAKAEQLLTEGAKSDGGVKLAVTDVALRYARGDFDGAINELKSGMPADNNAGYQEVLTDLEAARQP